MTVNLFFLFLEGERMSVKIEFFKSIQFLPPDWQRFYHHGCDANGGNYCPIMEFYIVKVNNEKKFLRVSTDTCEIQRVEEWLFDAIPVKEGDGVQYFKDEQEFFAALEEAERAAKEEYEQYEQWLGEYLAELKY